MWPSVNCTQGLDPWRGYTRSHMITPAITAIIIALITTLLLASSPVNLGIWIIFVALIGSVTILTSSTSWLAIITFLIYVGGLLVIFAYFTATSPNQTHNFAPIIKILSITTILWRLLHYPQIAITPSYNPIFIILETLNGSIYILLVILLLLTIIICVKTTQSNSGPLRKFNV